jgi:hypothetical protein
MLVVVLTLGVGIGTSVTTFTVVQGVLWKPLPYPNAARLVLLDAEWNGNRGRGVAPLEIRDLKTKSRSLDSIAVFSGVPANLTISGELERVSAGSASSDALKMLGADPPALGRLPDDRTDFATDGRVNAVAVAPIDITTLVSVALLIALAAIGAAGLPAWRAARVDPSVALRRE